MLYDATLHPEDGGSMILRNVGILPHHYKISQPRRPLQPEDVCSIVLRNVSFLRHHNQEDHFNLKMDAA
jgi:hypothetical protein